MVVGLDDSLVKLCNSTNISLCSNFSNTTKDADGEGDVHTYVILTVLVLVSATTLVGNILVFVAFIKFRYLRTATNYLILSLSVADLFVGMFSVNMYAVYVHSERWVLGIDSCMVWLTMDYSIFQASVFGVVVITIDRLLMIKYPWINHKGTRTKFRVKLAILFTWLTAFSLWLPPIIATKSDIEKNLEKNGACSLNFGHTTWFILIFDLISYIIPDIIMIVIAIYTCHTLLGSSKKYITNTSKRPRSISSLYLQNSTEPGENASLEGRPWLFNKDTRSSSTTTVITLTEMGSPITRKKESKRKRQSEKLLTFVILMALAFTLTITPYAICSIIKTFSTDIVSIVGWEAVYTLGYVNSLLNPICYAIGNRNFNRAFKAILCGRSQQSEPQSLSSPMISYRPTSAVKARTI